MEDRDQIREQISAATEIIEHLAALLFAVGEGARTLGNDKPCRLVLAGILEGGASVAALARDLLEKAQGR